MRPCLLAFSLFLIVGASHAQPWPTMRWTIVSIDEEPLDGERAVGAEVYRRQLEDASAWLQGMGFRAPEMHREPFGPYIGYMKPTTGLPENLGAHYVNERVSGPIRSPGDVAGRAAGELMEAIYPPRRIYLSGEPEAWAPTTAWNVMLAAGPAHELFHAIQAAYGGRRGAPTLGNCQGSGHSLGWIWEGAASAVQMRWLERSSGTRFAHPYEDPSRSAWTRYFDHSLHRPQHTDKTTAPNLSWVCGYGSWYFWDSVGAMLIDTPGWEMAYLQFVFGAPNDWSDYGLKNLDFGLREAARVYGSSSRYDEGLYEVYPAFIAEYVQDPRFYERTERVDLRGRSEVKWLQGTLDPISSRAFEVHVSIDEAMSAPASPRVLLTLDPQSGREQIHLIEGAQVITRPLAEDDPYTVVIPVQRDTTLFVRLANVAPDGPATEAVSYELRVELGGFYGTPASGPYVATDVRIPPGFAVIGGPPELSGCIAGPEGGSVFDLVTADEAMGDLRRMYDGGDRMLETMGTAMQDGELPIPNATPAQREAFRRAHERGDANASMMTTEAMQQQIAEARAELAQSRLADAVEPEEAIRFRGRSRLEASLVGRLPSGEPCQILVSAVLDGEDGGAQSLSVVEDLGERGDPFAVGIEEVQFFAGTLQDAIWAPSPYTVCMMTREQQAHEAASSCPTVCTAGQLALERAEQGHLQGTLRVDLVRDEGRQDARGCPVVDTRELMVSFNITSANAGQDTEMFRSLSDEMLRQMGYSQEDIDALRRFDGSIR